SGDLQLRRASSPAEAARRAARCTLLRLRRQPGAARPFLQGGGCNAAPERPRCASQHVLGPPRAA
ncbi:MAG: hypothetical protein SGPRY_013105, partial [Prymnesium sp.]